MALNSLLAVLRYTINPRNRETIRKRFLEWRAEKQIPTCCDNENCRFNREPLVWNGKPLPLILDHENGVNSDNRPENLRFLCANCDSQLETRGGRNRGRIEKSEGGFAVVRSEGKKDYFLPTESGHIGLTGHAPTVKITDQPKPT